MKTNTGERCIKLINEMIINPENRLNTNKLNYIRETINIEIQKNKLRSNAVKIYLEQNEKNKSKRRKG